MCPKVVVGLWSFSASMWTKKISPVLFPVEFNYVFCFFVRVVSSMISVAGTKYGFGLYCKGVISLYNSLSTSRPLMGSVLKVSAGKKTFCQDHFGLCL